MALPNQNKWYEDLKRWEIDRARRVEEAKKLSSTGIPYANQLMIDYDDAEFREKEGTIANKSSKWRTKLVEDLSSKSYGKTYDERLDAIMNEAGIPSHHRYAFAKWKDAKEQGVESNTIKGYQDREVTKEDELKLNQLVLENRRKQQETLNSIMNPKPVPQVGAPKPQGATQDKNMFDQFLSYLDLMNPFTQNTDDEWEDVIQGVNEEAAKNPVLNEVDRFTTRTTNSALLGLPQALSPDAQEFQNREGVGMASDIVADILGYAAPGVGAATALRSTGLTGRGMNALQQARQTGNLSKNVIAQGAKDAALEGALIGGGMSLTESAIRLGLNPEDTTAMNELQNLLINTAGGAVLDPLLTVGMPVMRLASQNAVDNAIGRQMAQQAENLTPLQVQSESILDVNPVTSNLLDELELANVPSTTATDFPTVTRNVEVEAPPTTAFEENPELEDLLTKQREWTTIPNEETMAKYNRLVETNLKTVDRYRPYVEAEQRVQEFRQQPFAKINVDENGYATNSLGQRVRIPKVAQATDGDGIDLDLAMDYAEMDADELADFLRDIQNDVNFYSKASRTKNKLGALEYDRERVQKARDNVELYSTLARENLAPKEGVSFGDYVDTMKQYLARQDELNQYRTARQSAQTPVTQTQTITEEAPLALDEALQNSTSNNIQEVAGSNSILDEILSTPINRESMPTSQVDNALDQVLGRPSQANVGEDFYQQPEVQAVINARAELEQFPDDPTAQMEMMILDQELLGLQQEYLRRQAAQSVVGQEPTRPTQRQAPTEDVEIIDYNPTVPKDETELSGYQKIQRSFVNDATIGKVIDDIMIRKDKNGNLKYLSPKRFLDRLLKLTQKKTLAAENSAERSLIIGKNASSVAAQHVKDRFSDFATRLNKSKVSRESLEEYAAYKRLLTFQDRMDADKAYVDGLREELESLKEGLDVNSSEAMELQELIDSYSPYSYTPPQNVTREVMESKIDSLGQDKELVKFYDEFIQLQQQNLKDLYEGGLIPKKLYDTLKEHKEYIPLKRSVGEDFTGTASRRPSNTLQRMQSGSEARLKPPINEAIRNAYTTRFNIEKNKALQFIPKFAKIDNEMFRRVENPTSRSITFFNKGKQVHYEVPPALKNYVDNFGKYADQNALFKTFEGLAQMQRKLTTQYSLTFQLKSLVREPVQAIITSRTNKGIVDGIWQTTQGYLDAMLGKQLETLTGGRIKSFKEDWEKMGGTGFQFMRMSDDDLQKVARDLMNEGTTKGNFKKINPFRILGKLGETVEAGARLGEYRSAKRQGYSDLDAFYEATDVTNYKRGGSATRELNRYIPFLNATIQGNSRVLRAFSEAPVRTAARSIGMLTTTAVSLYAMRYAPWVTDEQRNELNNLNQWQKDSYMFVPMADGTIIQIPKAFALGQMFMNPVEHQLDYMLNTTLKEKSIPDQVFQEFTGVLGAFVPPTDIAGLAVIGELALNRDGFTGFDIESQYDINAGVPKAEREAYNQSKLAEWVSDIINYGSEEGRVSPAQTDYLLRELGGSGGSQGLDMLDRLIDPVAPSSSLGTQLGRPLNQFILNPTTSGSGLQDLQALERKQPRPKLNELSKEEREAFDNQENYYNYLKEYEELQDQINDVRESTSFNSSTKEQRIANLRKRQDKVRSEALNYFNRLTQ